MCVSEKEKEKETEQIKGTEKRVLGAGGPELNLEGWVRF